MSPSAPEIDLSRRVAAMLAESWDAVPLPGHAGPPVDLAKAAERARAHLDLAGEVLTAISTGVWDDLRIGPASIILAGFGDAYAIASYQDPPGIRDGALPDLAGTEDAAIMHGVDRWCERHGHPLPIDTPDGDVDDSDRDEDSDGSGPHSTLAAVGLAFDDMSALRDAERDDWDGFDESATDAHGRLRSWLSGYQSVLRDFAIASDPASYLQEFRANDRPLIVREIAGARRSLSTRVQSGALAEAIVATGFALWVMRCAYMLTTAVDRTDAAVLHTIPVETFRAWMDSAGILAWLDDDLEA